MTREEAIKELNNHYDIKDEVWLDFPKLKEALEMAISALSAEPCEDYISRKDAIQALKADGLEELSRSLGVYPWNVIKMIPSVQPKKGEWIAYDHGMGLVYLKCPFCGVFIDKRHVEHNFCGKCGAKLSGEKSGLRGE